jgi:hypothetical protein
VTYIVQFQNGGCVMNGQIIFLAISLNFHRIVLCFSCCVVLWTHSLWINVFLLVQQQQKNESGWIKAIVHQSIPAATIPPPGTVWGLCTCCPHGWAFAAACSPGGQAFVNIGLLPLGICCSQRKDRGHKFSFVVWQNGRLLNTLNKFYIILLLNVGFQVWINV